MRILVTGGSGFIGRLLCPELLSAGHEVVVLTRSPQKTRQKLPEGVQCYADLSSVDPCEAVINLAGAGIADKRWTEARKQVLKASRLETTQAVVEWMATLPVPPTVMVSASAVGWYGEQGQQEVDESTPPTSGFTHELCEAWEQAAQQAEALGVRVCCIRLGVVLDQGGGSLAKMLPAFKLGLGGRLGDGQQWMPWIHRQDVVRVVQFLLAQPECSGPYNTTAPEPVTNAEFTRALGRALHRPTVLPVPSCMLSLALGDMASLLLGSDRLVPRRLQEAGFQFRYSDLDKALADIMAT